MSDEKESSVEEGEESEEESSEEEEEEDEEDEEDDESAARRGAGDESDAASSLVSGELFGAAGSAGARSLSADGAPDGSVVGASGDAAVDEPGGADRGPRGGSGVPDAMMIKMERIEIGDSKGSSILGDLKKQQKMSALRREGGDVPEGGADALPDDEDEEAAAKRASADDPLAGLSEQELADHREIFGLVDTDGTGAIDRGELQRLMHMVGMKISEEQMEVVMQEVRRRRRRARARAPFRERPRVGGAKLRAPRACARAARPRFFPPPFTPPTRPPTARAGRPRRLGRGRLR